ncbi:hypothetical protein DFH11DRAFT_1689439 [Phellopilus nigrolimitatus]|nr:hypothetical protein DFH11DRAFT_1689439 [Phellopilus nigrolimitatus]
MVHDISETPPPAVRRDASYYFVLFFFVGPIWSVVPVSWAYVLHSLSYWKILSYSSKGQVLFVLALCEVLFSIYYYACIRRISGPSPNRPTNIIELQQAFKRVLQSGLASLPADSDEKQLETDRPTSPDCNIERLERHDPRAIDFRNRLRTWYGKVPWSYICREHIHSWLYWSTFNAALPPRAQIPSAHRDVLDEATELLEKRVGCKIPDGSNPSVKTLLLTIDPVNVLPRPLVWYLFVKAANVYLLTWYEINYQLMNGRFKDLEYLVHIPRGYDRAKGPDPVVFFHGLGLGVFQYQRVLSHILNELPHIPLLIPLQPQISQNIFHPRFLRPMLRHETVACLTGLLDKLGWAGPSVDDRHGITLLSHSNGSYAHAWMLKSFPKLVKRSCFVDPVTFCSWEGDVCYNFVYRTCTTGVELVIRYFVGTELGVANLLQRHFDWLSNTLWFGEVDCATDPTRALFLLGGKDCIVDAERVKKYLISHGVRKNLWYDPNGRHGQALLAGEKGITRVIEWINDNSNVKN